MKNKGIIFLFLSLIIISSGCKKKLFDYRNKYTGDYNFVYSYSSWTLSLGVYESDTIYYSGKVYYDKKSKGIIKINYTSNATLELQINKNGDLSLQCGTTIGKFENKNKLTLNYSTNSCPGGGLGGGSNFSITGIKQ
jgi:hypothetical protein